MVKERSAAGKRVDWSFLKTNLVPSPPTRACRGFLTDESRDKWKGRAKYIAAKYNSREIVHARKASEHLPRKGTC